MKALTFNQRHIARQPFTIIYYLILMALAAFAIGPLMVLVFNSLKSQAEIGENPIGFPLHLNWENYTLAWQQGNYNVSMLNSIILTLGTAAGVCILAGLAAYAMCRLDLPGSEAIFIYLAAGVVIPPQLYLIPLYFLWINLNLVDTLPGLMIIDIAICTPYATLLLRSFFMSIPREFDEAARLDGANELQVMTRVVLPLAWPGFLTIALIAALNTWNEFLFAVTFMQSENSAPISTSLLNFVHNYARDWGLTNAASVIMTLPIVLLFIILQRRFISGLTVGGLGK